MSINFLSHLQQITRVSEEPLDEDIIKMHKRERNFPFAKNIENLNFNLNQNKFNYPNLNHLYDKLISFYKLKKNNLILTAGCDIALRTVYETIGKVESIFLPNTCYAMNYVYKRIYQNDANIISYEFDKYGNISEDIIINQMEGINGTKMLVLESPSGFTGQSIKKVQFEKILSFCEKNQIILLVDETYLETRNYYWSAKEFIESPYLIVITSFSKAYGIAGLRAGLIISNFENTKVLKSVNPMHEISSFTSFILGQVLFDESLYDYRKEIELDEEKLVSELGNKNGFNILKTKTNFVLFNNSYFDCKYLHDFLLERKLKIKINKSVLEFGDWCSVSIGNRINNQFLIESLSVLK